MATRRTRPSPKNSSRPTPTASSKGSSPSRTWWASRPAWRRRGKVPFASTFACFLERAVDQIRMAAISFANIKLVGSHCGRQHRRGRPVANGAGGHRHFPGDLRLRGAVPVRRGQHRARGGTGGQPPRHGVHPHLAAEDADRVRQPPRVQPRQSQRAAPQRQRQGHRGRRGRDAAPKRSRRTTCSRRRAR